MSIKKSESEGGLSPEDEALEQERRIEDKKKLAQALNANSESLERMLATPSPQTPESSGGGVPKDVGERKPESVTSEGKEEATPEKPIEKPLSERNLEGTLSLEEIRDLVVILKDEGPSNFKKITGRQMGKKLIRIYNRLKNLEKRGEFEENSPGKIKLGKVRVILNKINPEDMDRTDDEIDQEFQKVINDAKKSGVVVENLMVVEAEPEGLAPEIPKTPVVPIKEAEEREGKPTLEPERKKPVRRKKPAPVPTTAQTASIEPDKTVEALGSGTLGGSGAAEPDVPLKNSAAEDIFENMPPLGEDSLGAEGEEEGGSKKLKESHILGEFKASTQRLVDRCEAYQREFASILLRTIRQQELDSLRQSRIARFYQYYFLRRIARFNKNLKRATSFDKLDSFQDPTFIASEETRWTGILEDRFQQGQKKIREEVMREGAEPSEDERQKELKITLGLLLNRALDVCEKYIRQFAYKKSPKEKKLRDYFAREIDLLLEAKNMYDSEVQTVPHERSIRYFKYLIKGYEEKVEEFRRLEIMGEAPKEESGEGEPGAGEKVEELPDVELVRDRKTVVEEFDAFFDDAKGLGIMKALKEHAEVATAVGGSALVAGGLSVAMALGASESLAIVASGVGVGSLLIFGGTVAFLKGVQNPEGFKGIRAAVKDLRKEGFNKAVENHPEVAMASGGVIATVGVPLAMVAGGIAGGPVGWVVLAPFAAGGIYTAVKGISNLEGVDSIKKALQTPEGKILSGGALAASSALLLATPLGWFGLVPAALYGSWRAFRGYREYKKEHPDE